MQTHDWGIAVIKAQANLPDALPGQNVTFLLYGDTTLDNPSPDMHAVTVSTRIGNTSCSDVPDSAVLIQSPTGAQVAMNINGADVTLGSTAYVTASLETQRMTFAILEGEGMITAQGVTQIVQARYEDRNSARWRLTGCKPMARPPSRRRMTSHSLVSPPSSCWIAKSSSHRLETLIRSPATDTPTPVQQVIATDLRTAHRLAVSLRHPARRLSIDHRAQTSICALAIFRPGTVSTTRIS